MNSADKRRRRCDERGCIPCQCGDEKGNDCRPHRVEIWCLLSLSLNQQQRRWTTKKRILHLGIIESENIYFAATGDNPQLLAPTTQARQYNRQVILPSAVPTYETTAASGDGEDARS